MTTLHAQLDHQGLEGEIRSRFHEVGQRFTQEREALLEVLLNTQRALTPQELYEAVKLGQPVGLTTAYRIIETLTRLGFMQVILIGGELRYRLCAPTHHHHLVCTQCQNVEEFGGCDLEGLSVGSFRPTSHRIEMFGLCGKCQSGEIL